METTENGHQPVAAHLWRFAREHDRLRSAANQLDAFLRELMDEATITVYRIDTRAKTLDSYQEKSERVKPDGSPKYPTPATQIEDCIAARIIVFTNEARTRACDRVREVSEQAVQHNPGHSKSNGYDSEHFTVPDMKRSTPQLIGKSDLVWYLETRPALEVQIRTVAGHAWAEYEHDIRYKPSGYDDLPADVRGQVDQLFIEAGGLRKNFDSAFSDIQRLLEASDDVDDPEAGEADPLSLEPSREQVSISADSLAAFLEAQYPEATPTREPTLAWLEKIFEKVGFSTIDEIQAALTNIDSAHVASLMDYQFAPTSARRLDDDLLAALGERYIEMTGPKLGRNGQDRSQLLEWRLRRVRRKMFVYEIVGHPRLVDKHLSAARSFREITRIVAESEGLESAVVDGAVALSEDELSPSARARRITSSEGDLWVATNLNRSAAERLMATLLERTPGSGISVLRAGERIIPAPTGTREDASGSPIDEF